MSRGMRRYEERGTHWNEAQCVRDLGVKERVCLEDLGVAGKIILKLILKIAWKLVDSIQPVQDKGH